MIRLSDGREIRVRPNGMSFLTISDVHDQLTLDHNRACELAACLQAGRPYRVPSNTGRLWSYNGGLILGCVNGDSRHKPWHLESEARAELAERILAELGR